MFREAATHGDTTDLEEYTSSVTSYISKCIDVATISKSITTCSNQKPWMTAKSITKYRPAPPACDSDASLADALNSFYARFEAQNDVTSRKTIPPPEDQVLCLTTADVRKTLCRVNPRKAAGPDNIPGRVLRECAEQLADVFTNIFNISLSSAVVPMGLKTTTIILVPKKSPVSWLNYYRPVALTPIIMKCFERLVMRQIMDLLPPSLYPMQFAYRPNRSTDDAISTTLISFNTIIPQHLTGKVSLLGINTSLCNWILDFLTGRPQSVWIGNSTSSATTLNTGAPQGCMLSPLLFTLLTHDCAAMHSSNHIIKFADDTTVVGLISKNDKSAYREEVQSLTAWCKDNNLYLNVEHISAAILALTVQHPALGLSDHCVKLCEVPACFKHSTIIPIPKKPKITGLNDYRPVALTSVVMKSFERLVLAYLKNITGPLLDPLQFAYRANRSMDDAVNMGLHFILQHLDKSGTYGKFLFEDFSSAFNTIIPKFLQNKLTQLFVPSSICQWITSFLTDRHQLVKLGKFTSNSRTTSTGAPQGCVLSPLLFSLYTNDCTSTDTSVKLLKFADDTTVIGLIQDGDESVYRQEVEQLAAWCSLNNLELNTLKTVEMIVDFRRNTPALPPLTIMNNTVPTVESFRFLGTTISQDLKWDTHIDSIIKKAQQRLYFLRQPRKFNLPQELLTQFYSAVIESVLCTSITVWFGSATKSDIRRLQRTVRTAERTIGAPLPTLQELYTSR
ncbi:hypothetical protein QTP86_034541, partial [Hemibagrus guttatus]